MGSPLQKTSYDTIKDSGRAEKISESEFLFRSKEFAKCMIDPIYFLEKYYWIRSIDFGTILLPLYPKQTELIKSIYDNRFTICLASRQSGKTTAYVGICLHTVFFKEGKEIVILANKEATAIGILKRIKRAFEWIPEKQGWIKPKVTKWSDKQIEFDNGCSITAMASSSDAARSTSAAMLIIDECAFIPKNIMQELWASVFPTISRSETSKVVLVSTANGIGGLFYDIWQDATISNNSTWNALKIDWWDVPGRDEAWKQEQIRGFGPNGQLKFDQEFNNSFLGSAPTLIDSNCLSELLLNCQESTHENDSWIIGNEAVGKFEIDIFKKPLVNHAYIIGGDVSEGIGLDYSIAKVFDITDTFNVEEVASFVSNTVNGPCLGYIFAKLASRYNNAYVACERNGVSISAIDSLWRTFEYDNIIDIGSNKHAIGIFSNHATKLDACLWFRERLKQIDFNLILHDSETILELQKFERVKSKSMTRYEASVGHDDRVISVIWAIYCLKEDILNSYYDIIAYAKNIFGVEVPARLKSEVAGFEGKLYSSEAEIEADRQKILDIPDAKLKLLSNSTITNNTDDDDVESTEVAVEDGYDFFYNNVVDDEF